MHVPENQRMGFLISQDQKIIYATASAERFNYAMGSKTWHLDFWHFPASIYINLNTKLFSHPPKKLIAYAHSPMAFYIRKILSSTLIYFIYFNQPNQSNAAVTVLTSSK